MNFRYPTEAKKTNKKPTKVKGIVHRNFLRLCVLHILCSIFILNIKCVVNLLLFLTDQYTCFVLPSLSASLMICLELDVTADFKTSLLLSPLFFSFFKFY